ncbi:hypothetical protein KCP69_07185 [Salmonella enterica subsp. enterica]|nr:hypothetical protein KCP69_07185 [Salmonella enterica subsp. enterica]
METLKAYKSSISRPILIPVASIPSKWRMIYASSRRTAVRCFHQLRFKVPLRSRSCYSSKVPVGALFNGFCQSRLRLSLHIRSQMRVEFRRQSAPVNRLINGVKIPSFR